MGFVNYTSFNLLTKEIANEVNSLTNSAQL
jgi:hypothetical protein